MSCIYSVNCNTITVIGQERLIEGRTLPGLSTTYKKSVLEKFNPGSFNEAKRMLANGASSEEVWEFCTKLAGAYIRKCRARKNIKGLHSLIVSIICKTKNLVRGNTREFHSTSKKTASASTSNNTDSGDPDQPDPPSPPGLAYLFAYPRLITHTHKKNRYSSSWQSAPNSCSMFGGGQR